MNATQTQCTGNAPACRTEEQRTAQSTGTEVTNMRAAQSHAICDRAACMHVFMEKENTRQIKRNQMICNAYEQLAICGQSQYHTF